MCIFDRLQDSTYAGCASLSNLAMVKDLAWVQNNMNIYLCHIVTGPMMIGS